MADEFIKAALYWVKTFNKNVKEKIWMQKLIDLLNEYEPYIASDGEHRDNLWGYAYQWHSAVFPKELAESYIISARYGFIKWLVENDKINFNGIPNVFTSVYAEKRDDIYYEIEHNNYSVLTEQYWVNLTDRVIMLLSISSSPIEDLVGYLK